MEIKEFRGVGALSNIKCQFVKGVCLRLKNPYNRVGYISLVFIYSLTSGLWYSGIIEEKEKRNLFHMLKTSPDMCRTSPIRFRFSTSAEEERIHPLFIPVDQLRNSKAHTHTLINRVITHTNR